MHTAIGSLRLRSRGAHCDRILAVEVQGCTLRSGAGQDPKQIGDEDWRGRKQGGRRKEEDEEAAEAEAEAEEEQL